MSNPKDTTTIGMKNCLIHAALGGGSFLSALPQIARKTLLLVTAMLSLTAWSAHAADDTQGGMPVKTSFELPQRAEVSLGVFDGDGKLLRHLLKSDLFPAGKQVVEWDGLDQWGRVIKPGEYVLKGVCFDPLKLDYVMTATNAGMVDGGRQRRLAQRRGPAAGGGDRRRERLYRRARQ